MIHSFVSAAGNLFLGLVLYEIFKTILYGSLIFFVTRALGVDFSILQSIYDTVGWYGIGAALVLYLIRAISNVEQHLKKYENRILKEKK